MSRKKKPHNPDPSRLLARDSSRGYTDKPFLALVDAGEAVPEDYQREISKRSEETWKIVNAEELAKQEDRSVTNKLREVRIRARKAGVDIDREMADVQRAIERARQKLSEAA